MSVNCHTPPEATLVVGHSYGVGQPVQLPHLEQLGGGGVGVGKSAVNDSWSISSSVFFYIKIKDDLGKFPMASQ